MLVRARKPFVLGSVMAISFLLVFVFMFTPSFGGENAFQAADRLFNSISKGSTYYVPELREKTRAWRGAKVDAALRIDRGHGAAWDVLVANQLDVTDSGSELQLKADLAGVLDAALDDADTLFDNDSEQLRQQYGLPEKQVLYAWWQVLVALERALTRQEQFAAAAFVSEVKAKGVEVAYNFYGVEPEGAVSKAGILTFSLVFYVFYTLWWGYAVYFLAQGLGLQLKAGGKKEV